MLGYRYDDHIAGFRGCVPPTVPDRDVADLVIQVLRAQPERRSQAAAGIIAHVGAASSGYSRTHVATWAGERNIATLTNGLRCLHVTVGRRPTP
jgi:hypothetical protein